MRLSLSCPMNRNPGRYPASVWLSDSLVRGALIVGLATVKVVSLAPATSAQTVRVDARPSHVVNSFRPPYALGTTVDRVPSNATDAFFEPATLKQILSAGWGVISYRQNTELFIQAWHWNPRGRWSDPSGKGYFTGDSTPGEMIRHSFGYALQHRGFTRNGGTEDTGFSRLNDGDLNTYWKSNPYLAEAFTGEDDSLHPQWVVIDLESKQDVNAIRIAWAEPFARSYRVQYFTGADAMDEPAGGAERHSRAASRFEAGHHAIRACTDDLIVEYMRHAWNERSPQLRRLRDQRALCWNDGCQRKFQRSYSPLAGSAPVSDVLFLY
jgi:hypothetical protein